MTGTALSGLVPRLRAARGRMLDDVATLVSCESPSDDLAATRACTELVADMGADLIGSAAQAVTVDGRRHLIWRSGGATTVLLVGHCDTVWPMGTLDRWPFAVDGDRATGPGVFDMKTGLVQLFHALSVLDDLTGVTVLVTSDEELGSPSSRQLIEDTARGARAAFVLEASAGGALKTVRKGTSIYRVLLQGKASHAGLEPEAGVNTTVEAAHQVLAINALGDARQGTTVTPTVLRSGRTTNTVPDAAELAVDVRATSTAEQQRVDAAMAALTPALPRAALVVEGGINRPPLDAAASAELFALANRLSARLGLPALESVAVGGASDGNFTAGVGVPTLDGLGAVGDHAHAEGEWASVSAMPDRAALLAALVHAVQTNGS
ncbi:MAG TPA: M20 family metallopeptidase [Nakamurella sp.]|nr:M20 family metallopeptidase [Nakamurella sp.]